MSYTQQKGFTLLEILVVLAIIGFLAAVTAPLVFKSLNSANLRTSVRNVASLLRKARNQAISQKKNKEVTIDLDGGNFRSAESSNRLPEGVRFFKVESRKKEEISNEQYTFIFYPKGNSNGGTIYIRDEGKGGFKIEVDFILGKVIVRELGSEDMDEDI